MRLRTALFAFLIGLPALLMIILGAVYVIANVPRWIRAEPARVTREYRDFAEKLVEHPEIASSAGVRSRRWRKTGQVAGNVWGYLQDGDRVRVWVLCGPNIYRSVHVDVVRPIPYTLLFYVGGSVVAFLMAIMSVFAVWSFLVFMRERDDFIAATAHDLTTPLAGLRLQIGRNTDDARLLVERLMLVVSNLKDFLRLGGRRPPPARDAIDLVALVAEAYRLFAADYQDLFDGDDVEISADGSVIAQADATLVMQVLWNLFGNDLKYAAPHGRVSVRIRTEDSFAFVEFLDSGPGMTHREMRKAFNRYYRAKNVLQSGKGGFGIGLCTSREFARAMGGDLSVRANTPSGCIFTLKLPQLERESVAP